MCRNGSRRPTIREAPKAHGLQSVGLPTTIWSICRGSLGYSIVRQVPSPLGRDNRENGENPLRGRRCDRSGPRLYATEVHHFGKASRAVRAESQKTCLSLHVSFRRCFGLKHADRWVLPAQVPFRGRSLFCPDPAERPFLCATVSRPFCVPPLP